VAVLIDPVTHAPVRPPAGGILPGVFVTQRRGGCPPPDGHACPGPAGGLPV